MCLKKLHKFPRISFIPIKCYKIVVYKDDTTFTTWYTHKTYKFNESIKHRFSNSGIFEETLTGEVVHAYINMPKVSLEYLKICGSRLIECIIPPFTLHYKGSDGDIGARKLIPIRYIDETELILNNYRFRKRNITIVKKVKLPI